MFTLNTNLIPALKRNNIKFRYINGEYDPMTIIVICKSFDICRVDMNCNIGDGYNYDVYWFNTANGVSDLKRKYLMSEALINDICKVINVKYFKKEENNMNMGFAKSFTLSTNLVPALNAERIDFRTVYATLYKVMSLVVMYKEIDVCRVEVIQDLCSEYCYKVNWVYYRDIICFPTNYKHYTALIADIKKAINRLKNEGENKMDKKMYRVSDMKVTSSSLGQDEVTLTVTPLGLRGIGLADCDRIREAIEHIRTHEDSIDALTYCKADVISTYRLVQMFNKTSIKDVIFNNPATIIFWKDGTKTVVKAENEEFDPEKGLAMAIAKKALGNSYDYYDTFKKYVGRYEKKQKKGGK